MTKKEYQNEIEKRVYGVDDYLKIFSDMMDRILLSTVHMTDEELMYDRGKFISSTEPIFDRDKDGFIDKDTQIQSLCEYVEQYKRFGKILYSRDGEVDEGNGHKIRKDFFDNDEDDTVERDFNDDEYSKYKN
jgi:hypothetical protein